MKNWIILGLVLGLYFVSLFGGFIQDDGPIVRDDPVIGQPVNLIGCWLTPYYRNDPMAGAYRPLTNCSLELNTLVFGKNPFWFRLTNIGLYAGLCLVVFWFLKTLLAERTAFLLALIFAALPVHTEAVNNIVGRSELMMLLFGLVSLLNFRRSIWGWGLVSLSLSMLSKETGVIFLVLVLVQLWWGEKISIKKFDEEKKGISMMIVSLGIIYILLRFVVLGQFALGASKATIVENPLRFVSNVDRVRTAVGIIPVGMEKIIFPVRLSYDYSLGQFEIINNWFDLRFWLGGILILGSILSLKTCLRNNLVWILGMGMIWGTIAITGNILFPIGTIFAERTLLMPSLGVFLLVGMLMKKTNDKQLLCLLFLITIYSIRTELRNFDWLSENRLFLSDIKTSPDSVMALSNAAAAEFRLGNNEKAKEYLEKADKVYPEYPQLINNWGIYYLRKNDLGKAKEIFSECVKKYPGQTPCESNLEIIKSLR